ncbi:UTP--GlnB (protein PII) uridylyltransferase GlnD [Bisgaardia hudsonensis]|uniref:Bifunctional uridylyltransferase/uridylyl-removing enzyme n=1 Tax=Bisgaardia hudsonensis TaxID=109472 RepID=A0A4R2N122_9PAST|nr:bifunctional uridylyltransferase/uridylyl-removing protein GlnD [Bisgaardia hudsonensis]QLB13194.1 protein-P-II uridylyltransferase [Bisgaardia hudsonensis]TCP13229.1 UTP--GlnB (protein PII) uridylyltransferase GlnD [Bisgaardia hudsonensis]
MFTYLPENNFTVSSIKCQKQQLKQFELETFNQFSVYKLILNRSQFCDDLLIHLWQAFKLDQYRDLSLIAVGGYGRQEMFPLSDLDFLILSQEKISPEIEEKIHQFVQFLWDCGFDVGHSVRTLIECEQEGRNDITIATNLLESRYLIGNQKNYQKLTALLGQADFWAIKDFFNAKITEKKARYQRYNNTSYNLEPDIKHSPGGLRDLHLLYWLALRKTGAKNLETILNSGFICTEEYQALQASQSILFKVRFALHLLLKRYDNRLLFDRQLKVSELLGYQGEGNQPVEKMMRTFFQALQSISVLSEIIIQDYESAFLTKRVNTESIALDKHFILTDNKIYAKTDCFTQQPNSILELFYYLTQYSNAEIHSDTLRKLYIAVEQFQGYLSEQAIAREIFLKILAQPNAIKRAFSLMHKYGVLSIYLPQWRGIKGLMQFDLFHSYTVDEHTLRVMLKLESFLDEESQITHPLCSNIFSQLSDRTLLYIVALFHDIAKGRGGDHAKLGAEDVVIFAQQHGFDRREIKTMEWLVREHLLMSITAQRRDIQDPEVIMAFTEKVENKVRLDYLICLTVADICATNTTLWNSWKRALLTNLYQYTEQQFQYGIENLLNIQETLEQNKKQSLNILNQNKQLTETQIQALWQRFPEDYFLRNNPQKIAWHTELLSELNSPCLVKVSNRFSNGGTEIFIYCQDQTNLFYKVVAAIGKKKFSIHDAQIITSETGMVFDSFIITELDGSLVKFERRRELEKALTQVLSLPNKTSINKINTLSFNKKLQHFNVKTEIKFLNTEKQDQTEIEIIALDKSGLLAEISAIFNELNLNILSAKITTTGEKAEDFFILTNHQNQALTNDEREILKRKILEKI